MPESPFTLPAQQRQLWPLTAEFMTNNDAACVDAGHAYPFFTDMRIGGVSARELAQEGTPLFVVDEEGVRERIRHMRAAFEEAFEGIVPVRFFYAAKAFMCGAIAALMHEEGVGIDACSLFEMQTALAAGVPGSQLGLHGNNKTDEEISLALSAGLAHIVIDSEEEIERINATAGRCGKRVGVVLRLTTGVHAGGHEFIATAHEDQKFGLSIATGAAMRAVTAVNSSENMYLEAIHTHIGSQILSLQAFEESAERMMEFRRHIAEKHGYVIPEIDFGGGFAIRYTPDDPFPPSDEGYARAIAQVIKKYSRGSIPAPRVSFEPGRSIIGPNMVTLYRVGTMKNVQTEEGMRRYISLDGGMSENIRPVLYGAQYWLERVCPTSEVSLSPCIQHDSGQRNGEYTQLPDRVVGKHCESGDILIRECFLPADLTRGDICAMPATGAYGRSMASRYNMAGLPGVIAVRGGKKEWWIRPETFDDMSASDVFLSQRA